MKKFNLLAIILLFMVSCQKDDDVLIPINDSLQNISEENLTDESVKVSWEDLQASSYVVEYGISGFVKGEGTQVKTTEPSITLSNLTPETTYDYYVEAFFADRNSSIQIPVRRFTTKIFPVETEFKQNLSEMHIFSGNLSNLTPSRYTFEYNLNTTLYSDYTHKQRLIAVPRGTSMIGNGDGLPDFPENTVIVKTFYYNIDDRDISLGKKIIETRVMIKQNGEWEFGNYIWNEEQSEAVLDNTGSVVPLDWIDMEGNTNHVDYEIPSAQDCFTCHQTYGNSTPIGPKLRSMNFDIEGTNQLQKLKKFRLLSNVPDVANIQTLPNWEDTNLSDETRVRAYFDMNCAHCHSAGGYHTVNFFDALNVAYETPFEDSHIFDKRYSIIARIQTSINNYSMPYIGVTSPHQEALDLILPYLESLE